MGTSQPLQIDWPLLQPLIVGATNGVSFSLITAASTYCHQNLPYGYHQVRSSSYYVAFPDALNRYCRICLCFYRATYISKKLILLRVIAKGGLSVQCCALLKTPVLPNECSFPFLLHHCRAMRNVLDTATFGEENLGSVFL